MTTKRLTLCFLMLTLFFMAMAVLATKTHNDFFRILNLILAFGSSIMTGSGIALWIRFGGDS